MIDPAALLAHDFGLVRQQWQPRDAILYALGVGLGTDPLDERDLAFLDETRLTVLPTFALTLGSPGMWIRNPLFGVDFTRLVHSEQDAIFYEPLPVAGDVVATARIASLNDQGVDRGAQVVVERTITDTVDGRVYCTLRQTLLLRSNGGFGGTPAERPNICIPERDPDAITRVPFSSRAALIYRLSGDWNPLHINPAAARVAGFERPIMHGLGVYGAVAIAACQSVGVPVTALARMSCRFAGIVLPGEVIELRLWRHEGAYVFKASTGSRRVLEAGRLEVT